MGDLRRRRAHCTRSHPGSQVPPSMISHSGPNSSSSRSACASSSDSNGPCHACWLASTCSSLVSGPGTCTQNQPTGSPSGSSKMNVLIQMSSPTSACLLMPPPATRSRRCASGSACACGRRPTHARSERESESDCRFLCREGHPAHPSSGGQNVWFVSLHAQSALGRDSHPECSTLSLHLPLLVRDKCHLVTH